MTTVTAEQGQGKAPIVAGAAAQLARRYAVALYDLADEQNAIDAVASDFRAIRQLVAASAELQAIMANPRLSRLQQMKAMQALAQAAQFQKLTQNFLGLTAQNRRTALLPVITEAFLGEVARRRGETIAAVTSAQKLSPQQAEALTGALQKAAGGKIQITFSEDRDLLGGFTVKLGSRFVDASLKNKLARLARHMKEAA